MRRRVLLPLLVFGLIAVIAVLIPVGQAIAQTRTSQLALQRTAAAEQIVQRARTALAQGDTAALQAYLERFERTYGEAVLVFDERGDVAARAGDLVRDDRVDALVTAASRTLPQWSLPTVLPWGGDTADVAVPVIAAGDLPRGVVVLRVDLREARTDVTLGWLLVAAVGGLLLVALMAASLLWTRWVLRPVKALDAAVAAVAAHRPLESVPASGPPELRSLSRAFSRMAVEVEDALEQQRGFVADASHQLRNPLAAIRLRVDALPRSAEDAADVAAVEQDLDRLEHTVDRMLVLANAEHRVSTRRRGPAEDDRGRSGPLSAADLADRHRDRLAAAGLTLVADAAPVLSPPLPRADLDEIVDVLVDNALQYAGPGARVRVTVEPGPVIRVDDTGTDLRDDDLGRMGTRFWRAGRHQGRTGTGLGLAIVDQLMTASGGRLELARSPEGGLRASLRWDAA
ncbi:sensor histidine kinase [Microbacterium enclense]|uniref:sensor histidine kinase n=1 Tax=Microbacterium enclense TaxID=993073 RepID=UPI0036D88665